MLPFAHIHGMRPKKLFKLCFLYLMLHVFYYSGILYPVFMTNTIISLLQVYRIVPVWSSSYTDRNSFRLNNNFKAFAVYPYGRKMFPDVPVGLHYELNIETFRRYLWQHMNALYTFIVDLMSNLNSGGMPTKFCF